MIDMFSLLCLRKVLKLLLIVTGQMLLSDLLIVGCLNGCSKPKVDTVDSTVDTVEEMNLNIIDHI